LRQRLGDRVVDRHDLVRKPDEPAFQAEEDRAELSGRPGELRGEQLMRVVEQRHPLPSRERHPRRQRVQIVGMVERSGYAPQSPDGLQIEPRDPAEDPEFPRPQPETSLLVLRIAWSRYGLVL